MWVKGRPEGIIGPQSVPSLLKPLALACRGFILRVTTVSQAPFQTSAMIPNTAKRLVGGDWIAHGNGVERFDVLPILGQTGTKETGNRRLRTSKRWKALYFLVNLLLFEASTDMYTSSICFVWSYRWHRRERKEGAAELNGSRGTLCTLGSFAGFEKNDIGEETVVLADAGHVCCWHRLVHFNATYPFPMYGASYSGHLSQVAVEKTRTDAREAYSPEQ
ncbi:hypothetical protein BKA70DRAFT_1326412 [Coprinopsis sp. MPI-PUGE-AT-0042]|nr:hypothetical protein BKA70DRAFT_1326412 [Coprinopsis sp. MPI-PUGE-AT-0042]